MRHCPCCGLTDGRELLFTYQTTRAGMQSVFACDCGMIFCSVGHHVDYSESIYEMPNAIGSGVSEYDRQRLKDVALACSAYSFTSCSLLDVGSGQGGLLDAFRGIGYRNLTGLDPSKVCAAEVAKRGHRAMHGYLSDVGEKFDFITLSHVLEHIDDVRGFLHALRDHMNPHGAVYIEVPDASRHADYSIPFLELNSEHVNHFSPDTLLATLTRCGFETITYAQKEICLTSGAKYPAIWAVAGRKHSVKAMLDYIDSSQDDMAAASLRIEQELGAEEECIIWGAGEYLCHVLALPVFKHVAAVQIVDRNPALHGKAAGDRIVEPTTHIRRTCPIVIAAIVAEKSIRADIEKMGLPNKVIGLGIK